MGYRRLFSIIMLSAFVGSNLNAMQRIAFRNNKRDLHYNRSFARHADGDLDDYHPLMGGKNPSPKGHGNKMRKIAAMITAVYGIYWYQDYLRSLKDKELSITDDEIKEIIIDTSKE
jgi:hypothetical protein